MVSGEENTSCRDNQEKEPSVEATTTKAAAQSDITERGRPDTKRHRAHVDPQRLDVSAPSTTRGIPEDLPPPPLRRETDKSPERVMNISDRDEPAPTKRARAEGAEGSRREPRASDTQSASGSSKTEVVKDTSEYINYCSEERCKKEQECRAFKRSYAAELAALKAQMERVTSDLKRTQSQIHHRTGKAPAIAHVTVPKRSNPAYVQHEGGSGGAHNYQVESSGRGRGRGRGRSRGRGTWNNTWPRESKDYDEKLYCDFHKTSGHSTVRCRELGRQLIAKLTEGTLKSNNSSDFKPEEKAPADAEQQVDILRRQRRDDDMENEGQHESINMIMGGSQYYADNETALGAFQRRADVCVNISAPAKPRLSSDRITFDKQDTKGLDQPHNDPMVINLTVYDFNVDRVLIDTGSSVDVIFKKTLERMKIDLSTIKGRPKPITGFSNETTMMMGTIRLPVQACNIKKMVDFTVSDHGNPLAQPDESCAFNIPLMPQIPNTHRCYNQILMHPEDREKTAFITDSGIYYYKAAKQAKAIAETGVKDVEMTEAEADTEPAPLTTTPTTDADVTEAEVPDGMGEPEDLSLQNLLLESKDKDTTITIDTDEEPEYGCDKHWIDQIRAYIVNGAARDKRPDKSWKKYTAGLVAITREAKP
ncbi:hypothetical protein AALP_AAs49767U000300 [Arabis alpina]|uniref:Peptidase A2 domain-containing protein n=1 Tax=Arabis alpina TaxID=50452 RepID=A0A087FZT9_ARAAL|nr:hypothetical protein AALP_AAs49767U000300 [Arabis alpina]